MTLAEATGCISPHCPPWYWNLVCVRAISCNDNANGGSLGPLNGKDKALSRGCGPRKAPRLTGAPSAEALRKRLPIRTAFPAIWHSFDNPVTPAAPSDRRPQERLRKISRLLVIYHASRHRTEGAVGTA